MTTGWLVLDLALPHATSLKERRQELHALTDRLRQQDFAVAQIGPPDGHRRAFVAVVAVAGSPALLDRRLDQAEEIAFASPFEVSVLRRDSETWTGPVVW